MFDEMKEKMELINYLFFEEALLEITNWLFISSIKVTKTKYKTLKQ